jgi:dephospho-CoA kinase
MNKYILGVTGSMGCGKSYACNKLVEIGRSQGIEITHIDFDTIRRTEPCPYQATDILLKKSKGLVLLEWALLVEDNLLANVNNVLLVTSDYATQLKRVLGGNLPDAEVIRRIQAQLSNQEKEKKIRQHFEKIYVFDTTNNPGNEQYARLLEQILDHD